MAKTLEQVVKGLPISRRKRIEKRSNMWISTLRDYIEALGGELELVARMPGRKLVRLEGFYDANIDQQS